VHYKGFNSPVQHRDGWTRDNLCPDSRKEKLDLKALRRYGLKDEYVDHCDRLEGANEGSAR
jgi:hypothetical protein